MTLTEREERIRKLESERLEVVRKIENVMLSASKLRADAKLAHRSAPVGHATNDFRPIK